jgi:hypothetical protein
MIFPAMTATMIAYDEGANVAANRVRLTVPAGSGYTKLDITPADLSYAYQDDPVSEAMAKNLDFEVLARYDARNIYLRVVVNTPYRYNDLTRDCTPEYCDEWDCEDPECEHDELIPHTHHDHNCAGMIWAQSCIQVSFASVDDMGGDRLELGFARNSFTGELLDAIWSQNPNAMTEYDPEGNYNVSLSGNTLTYDVTVPVNTFLNRDTVAQGDVIGFNLVIAQSETGEYQRWTHTQVSAGITGGRTKNAHYFARLMLGEGDWDDPPPPEKGTDIVTITAPNAGAGITIDGVRDAAYAGPVTIATPNADSPANTATGKAWTAWNDNKLYFYIEVADTTRNPRHEESHWAADSIEIFIDWNAGRGGETIASPETPYWQLRIPAYDTGKLTGGIWTGIGFEWVEWDPALFNEACEWVVVPLNGSWNNGYIIEIAIPAPEGVILSEGKQIPFDFQINDNMAGISRDGTVHLAESGLNDQQWSTPYACMGLLTLGAGEIITPPPPPDEPVAATGIYIEYDGKRLRANEQIPSGQPFNAGGQITLKAVIEPAAAAEGKTVVWTSSNPNTVSVDSNGAVSLLRPGNEIITATLVDVDGGRTYTAKCRVNVRSGNAGAPVVPGEPLPLTLNAVVVESDQGYQALGVRFNWNTAADAIGYRIYRSLIPDEEGLDITDFPIIGTDFIDVNIDSNKSYYYSIRAVLKEADREGNPEVLGDASEQISVSTEVLLWDEIFEDEEIEIDPELRRNVLLMQIGNPNMTINGDEKEVDPGRGTVPLIQRNRTFVPIRAIVEEMGGDVDWCDDERKITLEFHDLARDQNNTVEMWLDRRDLIVNGEESGPMDVALESINGRAMVPVRFAAENLGCFIVWIGSTQEIVIVYFSY